MDLNGSLRERQFVTKGITRLGFQVNWVVDKDCGSG